MLGHIIPPALAYANKRWKRFFSMMPANKFFQRLSNGRRKACPFIAGNFPQGFDQNFLSKNGRSFHTYSPLC